MSYLEKYGMTEQEFDAVMNEAHDHFDSCRTMDEQQAQQLDCDFNMETEGREPEDAELGEANFDHDEPYDGGGWPGDGSGTDDLADYNANEADYYREDY